MRSRTYRGHIVAFFVAGTTLLASSATVVAAERNGQASGLEGTPLSDLYGTWDDTHSGKGLQMDLLRAGHPFCVRHVETRQACARTPLGGGVIGAAVVVSGNRLALPERYRMRAGSLCREYVPVYRLPALGSRLQLTLIGYRSSKGRPVSVRAVRAADCEPPSRWQHRLEARQLQQARTAVANLTTVEKAEAAGYVSASPCIPGEGAHYIKPALARDTVVVASQPELLNFASRGGGPLTLVAVEYWTADADGDKATTRDRPRLFGHAFDGPMDGHAPDMPVHYDLHVWIGADNPRGMFTVPNPTIRCPSQP
jgi:hypothetical protein